MPGPDPHLPETPDARPRRFDSWSARLNHPVLEPGDPGYDDARRVWNARFDPRPGVIVRPRDSEEVAQAVVLAGKEGLPVAIKGGGHAYAGNSVADGALLLDLGRMRGVTVDAEARRAVVQGGATWADVDAATTPLGLATPGGTVSSVGVAGFTLGGGAGWLTRSFGMAVDNLTAVEMVTAAGERVRASEETNPELFWGLRGGSGNFGVVTEFEFRLHEIPPRLLFGQVLYPLERAKELLRFYRGVFASAPDALAAFPFFIRIPPLPVFPEAIHGQVVLDFVVCWTGDPAEGEEWVQPFREQGEPLMDTVGLLPYAELQTSFDAGMGYGNRWYSRWLLLDELSDRFIDALVDGLDPFPGPLTAVYLGALGGAAGRVSPGATAYPHRQATDALHVFPGWMDPEDDERVMAWARRLYQSLQPFAADGVYVNMLAEDEKDRIPSAYGSNYARLRELKSRWDPENVFRANHNIRPEG
ncbi:MAG: FAD-binding oxidoreductase [Gemmatimonadota bacterium]